MERGKFIVFAQIGGRGEGRYHHLIKALVDAAPDSVPSSQGNSQSKVTPGAAYADVFAVLCGGENGAEERRRTGH